MLEKMRFFNLIKKNLSIVIFLLSLLFFIAVSFFGISMLDEGFLLYSSLQILDGKLPYTDFFIPYTPGIFYLHALIFKLFGINVLYPRIFQDIIAAATCVLIFLLSKKIMTEKYAVIASFIFILGSIPQYNTPFPSSYALFFGFVAIYYVTKFIENPRIYRYLCYSGFFTILSILFKQNIGALTFLSIVLFLFIQLQFLKSDYQKQLKKFLIYSFGIILLAIPFLLYLNYFSLTQFFLDDIYYHQINNYRHTMYIPFPDIIYFIQMLININQYYENFKNFMFFLPIIVFILSIVLLKKEISDKSEDRPQILTLYILFGIFQFFQIFPRSDYPHLLFLLPPVYILLLYITYRGSFDVFQCNKITYKKILLLSFGIFLILSICCFYLISFFSIFNYEYSPLESDRATVLVPIGIKQELESTTSYINVNSKSGDYILIVPYDAMYYVLTERNNPSKYNQFLSDFDQKNQGSVIQTLKGKNVQYIVYRDNTWMNFSEIAPDIDEYIKSHYFRDFQFQDISIYKFL